MDNVYGLQSGRKKGTLRMSRRFLVRNPSSRNRNWNRNVNTLFTLASAVFDAVVSMMTSSCLKDMNKAAEAKSSLVVRSPFDARVILEKATLHAKRFKTLIHKNMMCYSKCWHTLAYSLSSFPHIIFHQCDK